MAYDNTNTGALFKNDKQKDTQPDYRGSLNVDGTDYWISSWLKVSKDGKKFMSLSVSPKEATNYAPAPRKPSHDAAKARQLDGRTADRSMPHKQGFDDMDSDVPF